MPYLRYHEVEKLYAAWPYLQDLLETLKHNITIAVRRDSMGMLDEYIYSMAIGNKVISDTPPAGKISDSTGNIVANYHKLIFLDRKSVKKELGTDIYKISVVISKLEIAYRRLPFLQRRILELYYWEGLYCKEIVELLKKDGLHYSVSYIQEKRRIGMDRMTQVSKLTKESYEHMMRLIEQADTK